MRLGHFEVFVSNPHISKVFYRDILGFNIAMEQEGGFIWLEKDGIEFLLRPGQSPARTERYEHAPMGFVFYSSNLEGELQQLKSKGLEIRGTIDSDRCFTFTDPDGNWFQIVDPEDH